MIKHEVKELFIPEWRRLLLTIILSGVFYGLINCYLEGSQCLPMTTILLIIGGPETLFENLFDLFLYINTTQIVEKILVIITLYFLSCFIVYFYDKHEKKIKMMFKF
jgi:hypothetical protein